MDIEIVEYRETELTREVVLPICVLAARSFDAATQTPEQRTDEIISGLSGDNQEHVSGRRFVIWSEGIAIAHAKTFIRIIRANDVEIPVLALATVCSEPEKRGTGLGKRVTLKAFEQVGTDGWPIVSLFQSPVPAFYEKLNCRLVDNRFVNREAKDPEANPWRDDNVMIYPADATWPSGVIDLGGPDY